VAWFSWWFNWLRVEFMGVVCTCQGDLLPFLEGILGLKDDCGLLNAFGAEVEDVGVGV
jgi:hypothetical protein